MANAKTAASLRNMDVREFINEEIEKIFSNGSVYMVIPGDHDLNLLTTVQNIVKKILYEPFYGVQFLTERDAKENILKLMIEKEEQDLEKMTPEDRAVVIGEDYEFMETRWLIDETEGVFPKGEGWREYRDREPNFHRTHTIAFWRRNKKWREIENL
jgi:hypothetical protein